MTRAADLRSGRDVDPVRSLPASAPDHAATLTPAELRAVQAVIELGFPYMSRCDGKTVPSGPNAGKPWGELEVGP